MNDNNRQTRPCLPGRKLTFYDDAMTEMDDPCYEVCVLGCGPAGATLANLLGLCGVSVLVLEREGAAYPLPRAVQFDDEVMRVLQTIGLSDSTFLTRMSRRACASWTPTAGCCSIGPGLRKSVRKAGTRATAFTSRIWNASCGRAPRPDPFALRGFRDPAGRRNRPGRIRRPVQRHPQILPCPIRGGLRRRTLGGAACDRFTRRGPRLPRALAGRGRASEAADPLPRGAQPPVLRSCAPDDLRPGRRGPAALGDHLAAGRGRDRDGCTRQRLAPSGTLDHAGRCGAGACRLLHLPFGD